MTVGESVAVGMGGESGVEAAGAGRVAWAARGRQYAEQVRSAREQAT